MAILKLTVPDGEYCDGCRCKERRTDVKHEDYHCAIFGSRAVKKTRECVELTGNMAKNNEKTGK